MSISFTLHGQRPTDEVNARVDVRTAQKADRVDVAIGTASAAITVPGLYRFVALAACRMRIGTGTFDASQGEAWPNGATEIIWLNASEIVKVAAA